MLTNLEFVNKLKDIANNYKTLYVMGCFGAPMTEKNKTRYCTNHSYNKQPSRTAMIKAATEDTFGFDCVCLIKGILWGWSGDKTKTYGGAGYAINGVPDYGADTMITKCSDLSKDFSNIEIGEAVWMSGHIGVYIGDGLAVECTPRWKNCVQITACNRTISGYNRRDWTKHGKLPYVEYVTSTVDQPVVQQQPTSNIEVKGIDVSKWQGNIDWVKVKASDIKFAMIRLGYGSKDGTQCGLDNYFDINVKGALSAGVDIGCYFYTYGTTIEAVKREADWVVSVLNKYKGVFTYPIAFDLEDPSQQSLGKTTLTNMIIAFGDIVEKAGYWVSLYSNLNWLLNLLDDSKIQRFDHWLAQWSSKVTYKNPYGMWQYSSTGKVNGINGNVDLDIAYKDYPKLIRSNKLNGFTYANQPAKYPGTTVVSPPPTTEQPIVGTTSNEKSIYEYLSNKSGLNTAAIAGILSNLYYESGFKSNNLQNTSNKKLNLTDEEYTAKVDNNSYTNFIKDSAGYGLAQWTYLSRKQKLLDYAKSKGKSIGDYVMQLEYLLTELKSYTKVWKTLTTCSNDANGAYSCGYTICYDFEAPAAKATSSVIRGNKAKEYFNKYKDNVVVETPSTSVEIEEITFDSIKVNDIYNFNGTHNYASANSATGKSISYSGPVKITQKYVKNSKHPIHARSVNSNGAFIDGVYGWIDIDDLTSTDTKEYKVRVTASALNVRSGPGTNYKIMNTIKDKGVYTIVETSNGWGKLKSEIGWISLSYTQKV